MQESSSFGTILINFYIIILMGIEPSPSLIFVNVLLVLLTTITPLTSIPAFTITPKYIETGILSIYLGTHVFDTLQYYGQTSANSISSMNFTGTLLNSHTTAGVSINSIDNINFNFPPSDYLHIVSYSCLTTGTSIVYCLDSNYFAKLAILSNRYLFLDSRISSKITDFDWGHYYSSFGSMTLSVNDPLTANYSPFPPVNIATGTVFAAAFFNGCEMYASNSNLKFDLKVAASVPSSTTLRVKMTSGISTSV